ncbi:MAG: alanine racemase C-terminal domain-containing protein, partial [Candidatus Dadabacteria bacterium]
MKLKTRIIQTKKVPKGTRVSYGGTYTTERPSVIATLP